MAGAQALQQLSSEVIDDICRAGTTIVPGSACNGCFRFNSEVLAAVDVSSGSDCCLEDMARSCLELLDAVSSQWALLEAALGEASATAAAAKGAFAKRLPSSQLQGRPAKCPAPLKGNSAEAQQIVEMQGLGAAEEVEAAASADAAATPMAAGIAAKR